MRTPAISICVLSYGSFPQLAKRCIESIRKNCSRPRYKLIVGANAACAETSDYLQDLVKTGAIDQLHLSPVNINKCPMMRRMFEGISTDFIWWFDDDSYIAQPNALETHLQIATNSPADVVLWGCRAFCTHAQDFTDLSDPTAFVRSAGWYGGLTPPSWQPGGKGEFDFEGQGTGDGRWDFVLGGCWLARTSALKALDWPDRRLLLLGDDVLLGEAVRQQGWRLEHIGSEGLVIDTGPRRGTGRDGLFLRGQETGAASNSPGRIP
jgi:hypothetical protein